MDAHLIASPLQAGSAVRLERMSIEKYSELTDDIERKLDEADAAANRPLFATLHRRSLAEQGAGSMSAQRYRLLFNPIFEKDLNEITDYIPSICKIQRQHSGWSMISRMQSIDG